MKLADLKIYRFDIPLARTLILKNIKLTTRSGLLIALIDDRGNLGYGEISPLPGLHQESMADALVWLQKNKRPILQMQFPRECRDMNGTFEKLLAPLSAPPSARFGIEMAVLNLFAARGKTTLSSFLNDSPQKTIYINGLLSGSEEDILAMAKSRTQEGYETVKLKVGKKDLQGEINIVDKIRQTIGDKMKLRLDANRAWTLAEAVQFGRAVAHLRIEYIEEPLRDFTQSAEFFRETNIPIALDETLVHIDFEKTKIPPGVKALILKPSVIGGIEKAVRLIVNAKKRGMMPVLSSAFYSGVGLAALVQIAAAFIPGKIAMGLDTHKWLNGDVLQKPFTVTGGKISTDDISRQSMEVNQNLLLTP